MATNLSHGESDSLCSVRNYMSAGGRSTSSVYLWCDPLCGLVMGETRSFTGCLCQYINHNARCQ